MIESEEWNGIWLGEVTLYFRERKYGDWSLDVVYHTPYAGGDHAYKIYWIPNLGDHRVLFDEIGEPEEAESVLEEVLEHGPEYYNLQGTPSDTTIGPDRSREKYIERLRRLRREIYDGGSSHNPEYWSVASDIDEYIDMLERDVPIEDVKESARERLSELSNPHCEHEAPETVLAILNGKSNGSCQQCGRRRSMNPEGCCRGCEWKRENR